MHHITFSILLQLFTAANKKLLLDASFCCVCIDHTIRGNELNCKVTATTCNFEGSSYCRRIGAFSPPHWKYTEQQQREQRLWHIQEKWFHEKCNMCLPFGCSSKSLWVYLWIVAFASSACLLIHFPIQSSRSLTMADLEKLLEYNFEIWSLFALFTHSTMCVK